MWRKARRFTRKRRRVCLRKMGKPKSAVVSQRTEDRILRTMYPLAMHALARQGVLKSEHLESAERIAEVFYKNRHKAASKMEWCIAIEEEFIQQAIANWKKGKKFVAIVLYATAVEQYVNQTYALMLRAHGLENEEVEKIVRTLNIEPKLSWLMKLVAQREFPKALRTRLRKVFELRNAIVHYKALFTHIDRPDDSHSKIETELAKLKRLSLSRDYRLLTQALWKVVLEKDPHLDLAIKASNMILSRKGG